MIEGLFKTLLVVILLVILIPLVLLLFGEGALAYKIFGWAFPKDDKQEIVVQPNTSTNANTDTFHYSAEIPDLTIEHNQIRDGEDGMYVYSTQTWHNLKGVTCYSVLRFFDDEGKPLVGKRYKDDDGNFCLTGKLVSDGKKCVNDQRIFVPYSEFDFLDVGTTHYLCDIRLYIVDNEGEIIELAYSKPSRFHITTE